MSGAPRVQPIQLPPLVAADPGADCDGATFAEAQLTWSADAVSAIGAEISDSRLATLPSNEFQARRLRLAEVVVDSPAIITWQAPRSNWRGVAVTGGSIGVLDCSGARWDNVVCTGVRIGYLNLREAVLGDVLLADCRIESLDLTGADTTRVALVNCRVDELDLHNRTGTLDLSGLDVAALTRLDGASGWSGATLTEDQARWFGPLLARALGITVVE